MPVLSIKALSEWISASASMLMQTQDQAQRYADVVSHLEGLPLHLRQDIGVRDPADIQAAVTHGRLRHAGDIDRTA